MSTFTDLKQKAKVVLHADEMRTEAWFGANRYPFALGALTMGIVWWVVHFL